MIVMASKYYRILLLLGAFACACTADEPVESDSAELRAFAGWPLDGLVHPLGAIGGNRNFGCTFWGPSSGTQDIEVRWTDYDRTTRTASWDVTYVFPNGARTDRRFVLSSPQVVTTDGATAGRTHWQLREEYTGATCRAEAVRLPGEPDRLLLTACSTGYTLECRRKNLGDFAPHTDTYASIYDNYYNSGRNPHGCPQTDPDECEYWDQQCLSCGWDCLPGSSGEWICDNAIACQQGYSSEYAAHDYGLGCAAVPSYTCKLLVHYHKYLLRSRERRTYEFGQCYADGRAFSVLRASEVLNGSPHECYRAEGACYPPSIGLPPGCQFDVCVP